MSKQSWLPLVVAILPTPIGYLINQLPGIPDFPHKEWLIGSVVALLTAIGAYLVWQQGRSQTEQPIATLESGRRMRLIAIQVKEANDRPFCFGNISKPSKFFASKYTVFAHLRSGFEGLSKTIRL